MSTEIIDFNGIKVVVGLDWDLLDLKSSEKKSIREILKKNPGVKAGVVVKGTGRAAIGLMPPNKKKPNVPSGAALLALVNSQELAKGSTKVSSSAEETGWIVIQKIPDRAGQYWIVEIREEFPVPGSDKIVSLEEIRQNFNHSLNFDDSLNIRIFTKEEEVIEIIPPGFKHLPVSASEHMEKAEKVSKANLKTLSGVDPMILAVIGGGLLLVGAFFGWDYYKDMSAKKQALLNAAQEERERKIQDEKAKKDYQQQLETNVFGALDQTIAAVNNNLQTASPTSLINTWTSLIESVPLDHSGWKTTQLECSLETPEKPVCTVSMQKGPYGIIRVLRQDYPGVVVEGDSATYTIRGGDLTLRPATWNLLENKDEMVDGLVSDLQYLNHGGINFNQGASQEITQPITLPPPPNLLEKAKDEAGAGEKLPDPGVVSSGVALGKIAISGENLWRFRSMVDTLEKAGVSITSMNIDLKTYDKMSWTLQADFLIRTSPSPVIPTIITPIGPVTVKLPEKYNGLIAGKQVQGGIGTTTGVASSSSVESKADSKQSGAQENAAAPEPSRNAPPPTSFSLGLPDSDENETK